MAKQLYTITVNGAPAAGTAIDYKYGGTACTLTCSPGCARLEFGMGTKKDIHTPDFFRNKLVKDGLRRMYLLHAMAMDSRLWIETITVTRNEESAVYDENTRDFPFLFSMLTARELKLPESWRQERFLEDVLSRPKSETDNDARYACLFSFLAGIGKRYEIERFTCYWTAMNAHYNYVFSKTGSGQAGDAACIRNLLRLLGAGKQTSSRAERNETYKTSFGMMKSCLQGFSQEELEEIYRELYELRGVYGAVPRQERGQLYSHLHRCINPAEYAANHDPIDESRSNISAWGFLLLDYAYYMRCKYLHGNKATVLFSAANDPEISAFRCLNVFLGNYLKTVIPEMFRA